MKKLVIILIVLISLLMGNILEAQNVGIGSTSFTPDASAGLEINFSDKGLLIPRVAIQSTTTPTPVSLPAQSLLIYNTNTSGTVPYNVFPGFYYWDTTGIDSWVRIAEYNKVWLLGGNYNTNPSNNFVGTIDSKDLVFKTNNIERIRIKSDPTVTNIRVGIGTAWATPYPGGSTPTLLSIYDGGNTINDFALLQLGSNKRTSNTKVGEINFHSSVSDPSDRRTAAIESYLTAVKDSTKLSGDLRFFTNDTILQYCTEKMRITSNGNVGIGTENPQSMLTVEKNFNTSPVILTSNTTINIDCSKANIFILTAEHNATIIATNYVAGQYIYLIIKTSGSTSKTLTFSTGIKTNSTTLNTGTNADKYYILHFISDGNYLLELNRTSAL
ncbi:MAG TPA: hypothetical protein PKJ07_07980 [Bacteroidales bacterium]|nr:hypothetical protein [Bacteroidales bacterium]HOB28061.1 hypothetical protein [Bacteroidales bacterium]